MAFKETKRKGFNFFRSYYDVYNELTNDKDKLDFINALLDRQFLGVKPTNLKGMANFAYISQTNSIDSQVKGYEDKTGSKLSTPTVGGRQGGRQGGSVPPTLQVQVEVEEKVQDVIDFDKLLIFINQTLKREFKTINQKAKTQFKARLKEGFTNTDIANAIKNAAKDKYHKENNYKYLTPEYFSRSKTLDLHAQKTDKSSLSISEQISHIKNKPTQNT